MNFAGDDSRTSTSGVGIQNMRVGSDDGRTSSNFVASSTLYSAVGLQETRITASSHPDPASGVPASGAGPSTTLRIDFSW